MGSVTRCSVLGSVLTVNQTNQLSINQIQKQTTNLNLNKQCLWSSVACHQAARPGRRRRSKWDLEWQCVDGSETQRSTLGLILTDSDETKVFYGVGMFFVVLGTCSICVCSSVDPFLSDFPRCFDPTKWGCPLTWPPGGYSYGLWKK